MKNYIILLLAASFLLSGCLPEETGREEYTIWVEGSQQNKEIEESAYERLKEAGIDFKIDSKGNLLIREKDLGKAVMCCS
ncbi:hypothetical protein [Bacillus sp. AK031]